MDRLNQAHRASRVELPNFIIALEPAGIAAKIRRLLPIVPRYIGITAFMTCGAGVIVAASLLALSVD